jgi:hypothetical protein
MSYEFYADLWRWDARQSDSWTFASLPTDVADEINDVAGPISRGFGSLRVDVTIGATTWRTSIFPDAKRGTYVLPLRRAVRAAERLETGDTARIQLRLVDL